jgi:cyclophilin family peptidyl-prolyl cis-trans isomerase
VKGVEGPDIDKASDASDEEVQLPVKPTQRQVSDSDSFGSDASEEEDEPDRTSPTIIRKNDDVTRVKMMVKTSAGAEPRPLLVRLRSDWAPLGAARFLELTESKFFENVRFHRVVKGQLAQFGLPVDPALYQKWSSCLLEDDPVISSNSRGTLAFASRGPGTRNCQIFINLCNNKPFNSQGFAPFAEIVQGMEVADEIYHGYGEIPPKGSGPDPDVIKQNGLAYLQEWPKLSIIQNMEVCVRESCRPSLKTASFDDISQTFPGLSPKKSPTFDCIESNSPCSRKESKKVSFSTKAAFPDAITATRKVSSPERSPSPAGSALSATRHLRESDEKMNMSSPREH